VQLYAILKLLDMGKNVAVTIELNRDQIFTIKQLLYARCTRCFAMVNWIHERAGALAGTCCATAFRAAPVDGTFERFRVTGRPIKGRNLIPFRTNGRRSER
jgi:hypothetical protein